MWSGVLLIYKIYYLLCNLRTDMNYKGCNCGSRTLGIFHPEE